MGSLRYCWLGAFVFLSSCASLRESPLGMEQIAEEAPPRLVMRMHCGGFQERLSGFGACEIRPGQDFKLLVKVPPLEGRLVWTDGEKKVTQDFNWYPEDGFWIWKKKPIKDTWVDLSLGDGMRSAGEYPLTLTVAGLDKNKGVISSKGTVYLRFCDDKAVPCSNTPFRYGCRGEILVAGSGQVGVCERVAGSDQAILVPLDGVPEGAKVLLAATRLGQVKTYDVTAQAIQEGALEVVVPSVPLGYTLIDFRVVWEHLDGTRERKSGKVLVFGRSQAWTPLDYPHSRDGKRGGIEFVKPVFSDLLEVVSYSRTNTVMKRLSTTEKVPLAFADREYDQLCAYAWSRETLDLSWVCQDKTQTIIKRVVLDESN